MRVSRESLSDDADTAVAETIRRMAAYSSEDSNDSLVLQRARSLRGKNEQETIENIWRWVRGYIRFTPDRVIADRIRGAGVDFTKSAISEVLIRPSDMLRMDRPEGDCDDFSMLGASLLKAAGIPSAFVTVAASESSPGDYSHVYLRVHGRGFDASHGSYCGWEYDNRFNKRMDWSGETGMPLMLASPSQGMGGGLGLALQTAMPTGSDPIDWSNILSGSLATTFDILRARYAVPPEGTVIQTPGGMISRGATGAQTYGVQVSSPSAPGAIPIWVWIGLAVLVAFLLMGRRK